jgi:hypothetical protein
VQPLPASTSYPVAQRISPGGLPYYTSIILVDTVTGQPWSLTIAGGVVTLVAIPTVADIRADFATVAAVRTAVPTIAALRVWGF